jgi:hypothetical protein
MDHSESLANFMAVTDASESVATQMLEATGWSVEQAIELFFATVAAETAADADYARQLATGGDDGGGAAAGRGFDPDGVRPADERYHDTLTGVHPHLPHFPSAMGISATALLPSMAGGQRDALAAAGLGVSPPAQGFLDPFLDFRAAARQAAAISGAAAGAAEEDADEEEEPGSGGGAPGFAPVPSRRAGQRGGPDAGLAGMFAPPVDVLFGGTLEQARQAGQELDRWVLVNLQSNTEFSSHRLNRDTWHHEAVHSVLAHTFVFLQLYDNTADGRKFMSFYQLGNEYVPPTLPQTLLIDPVTGAKMHTWTGFVDPERFLEDIIPFCDATPSAGTVPHKRHKPAARPPPPPAAMTEDEEIAAAIAASLGHSVNEAGPSTAHNHALDAGRPEEAMGSPAEQLAPPPAPVVDAAQVAALALSRMPEEPMANDPAACSVAIRLPSGQRITRRFPKSSPAACLFDWAVSVVLEAAAGRPFRLVQALQNGSAALPRDGSGPGPSLEEAGLAGALLAMTWE